MLTDARLSQRAAGRAEIDEGVMDVAGPVDQVLAARRKAETLDARLAEVASLPAPQLSDAEYGRIEEIREQLGELIDALEALRQTQGDDDGGQDLMLTEIDRCRAGLTRSVDAAAAAATPATRSVLRAAVSFLRPDDEPGTPLTGSVAGSTPRTSGARRTSTPRSTLTATSHPAGEPASPYRAMHEAEIRPSRLSIEAAGLTIWETPEASERGADAGAAGTQARGSAGSVGSSGLARSPYSPVRGRRGLGPTPKGMKPARRGEGGVWAKLGGVRRSGRSPLAATSRHNVQPRRPGQAADAQPAKMPAPEPVAASPKRPPARRSLKGFLGRPLERNPPHVLATESMDPYSMDAFRTPKERRAPPVVRADPGHVHPPTPPPAEPTPAPRAPAPPKVVPKPVPTDQESATYESSLPTLHLAADLTCDDAPRRRRGPFAAIRGLIRFTLGTAALVGLGAVSAMAVTVAVNGVPEDPVPKAKEAWDATRQRCAEAAGVVASTVRAGAGKLRQRVGRGRVVEPSPAPQVVVVAPREGPAAPPAPLERSVNRPAPSIWIGRG
ncbi:unnamed protein product [Pedinophyceae sp. YPF-701]|nr:unnamed protein product [Pedinophyceae sp. YPF-701]